MKTGHTSADTLALIFRENPTTGLPRLEDPTAQLASADLELLQQYFHKRYQELVSTPEESIFTLDDSLPPHLPHHFRVSARWEERQRCPVLILTAVESAAPDDRFPAASLANGQDRLTSDRWQVTFLAELADLLAAETADQSRRSASDFVLSDLRALLKKNPQVFLLLLYAGYLHIGDALSLKNGHDANNKYVEAAHWLTTHFADLLPDGIFDGMGSGKANA